MTDGGVFDAADLAAEAVKVLKEIEWNGDPEGSYEYQDRTVACPSCNYCVDCESGLPAVDDGDEEEDEDGLEVRQEAERINHFADDEGWAIYDIDTDPAIKRDEDDGLFATDEAAAAFVEMMAGRGSVLHKSALTVVEKATKQLDENYEKAWAHADDCKLKAVLVKAEELGLLKDLKSEPMEPTEPTT